MKKTKNIRLMILVLILLVIACLVYFYSHKNATPAAVINVQKPETVTPVVPDTDDTHISADYNFDGYPDKATQLDCGATGNCSYAIDLYNPTTKKLNPVPSEYPFSDSVKISDNIFTIVNPEINSDEKIICSFANSGATTYNFRIYEHIPGYFVVTKAISRDYDNNAKLVQTTTNYKNGSVSGQNSITIDPMKDSGGTVLPCTLK